MKKTTPQNEDFGLGDVVDTPELIAEMDEMAEAAVRALNAGVLRDEAEFAARQTTLRSSGTAQG